MLKVTHIPIFEDNYVWLIHQPSNSEDKNSQDKSLDGKGKNKGKKKSSKKGKEVWVVDPGNAAPVIEYIEKNGLTLVGVLITHSHFDHTGGINGILAYKEVPIVGPRTKDIPEITEFKSNNEQFSLWGADCTVYELPGHMPEHLGYIIKHEDSTQIFSGDVLFSAGCGRIFSGTHAQLKSSLDRLNELPKDSLVYSTHEYTTANLHFAQAVEPGNKDIKAREQEVEKLRSKAEASLPTKLSVERKINPFLRYNAPTVVESIAAEVGKEPIDDLDAFTELRKWKDRF